MDLSRWLEQILEELFTNGSVQNWIDLNEHGNGISKWILMVFKKSYGFKHWLTTGKSHITLL